MRKSVYSYFPNHTAAAVKVKAANKDVSRRLALGPENYFAETFKQTSQRRDKMVCDEVLGFGIRGKNLRKRGEKNWEAVE